MAVTIKDVAALAGVSPSTVSRVCKDNPAISAETRERVRQAMKELGYECAPAPAARPQPIKMIGIVLPPSGMNTYENNFFLKAIRGISQVCSLCQTASTVVTGNDPQELLRSVMAQHMSRRVDAFILLYVHQDDPVADYLGEQGVLYAVVGNPGPMAVQTPSVDNDNLSAAREATAYLLGLGHRRVGYLGSQGTFAFAQERRTGYRLGLMLQGLPYREEYCVELEQVNSDAAALRALLARPDRPTAFVVSEDMLAQALERSCVALGLSIPEDVSIIAFNNSLYSQLAVPQLTTVEINSYQLGQEAARLVIRYLDNPNLRPTRIIVPHKIVPRDSCRRL